MSEKKEHIFYGKAKRIDIQIGEVLSVVINEEEAWKFGIRAVDKIGLVVGDEEVILHVDLTKDLVEPGEIGVFQDVYEKYDVQEGDILGVFYSKKNPLSVQAVKKKLFGKKLTEEEITALVHDMADNKLSDTLITYYASSSFFYKSRRKELYYTAKASAEYGNMIKFDDISVIKYCVGGVPGNETTMIVAPIVASLGINFPKTFSKAITSPAATGECVESLMDIEFTPEQMKELVAKTHCCLAWGKNLGFAPANDQIIKVSYPISMEAYSKMVVSIAAKIYAGGATHCLIDIPVGPTAKIKDKKTALRIKGHFEYICEHLGMKVKVVLTNGKQPIGKGIGPIMQVREVLKILQQAPGRSLDLEHKAIFLATEILKLTGKYRGDHAKKVVMEQLQSGKAWEKMKEIIAAQNGNPDISWDSLELAKHKKEVFAEQDGKIKSVDLKYLTEIARSVGCPLEKQSGLFLEKRVGNSVKKGETMFVLYSNDKKKIKLAEKLLENRKIFEISA